MKIEKNVPVHKIQAKWNTICAKKSKTDLKFQKKQTNFEQHE